ncbi:unnamed protein product [Lactuca saligna]|uniref:Uncharacterized protein n=1 Tax=Lactuca saligna TaxID=75948 RepID=A0AA35ZB29_LACSI|nr:unnamed protein product [Lactuca saligna]
MLVNRFIKKRLDENTNLFVTMKIFALFLEKTKLKENRAKDFIAMEQDVNLEEEMQKSDDDILESEEISHNTTVQNEETSPSVRSNKRKRCADDVFHNVVGLITESLKEISKDLNPCITFDMKINELSEKIPPKILKMSSLSQVEKFKALTNIRSDPIYVQNFWQIEEGDREV